MHADSSPTPAKKLGNGKTVKGMVVDPAIAGLEKGGGITKEVALTMLMRGQRGQLEAIGRGASKALFEIANDSSVDKAERKTAAGMLLWNMEKEMPAEDVAMCLILVGYPREKEIVRLESPKVDTVLKNILLNEGEEVELRARAALALRDRKFAGFERQEDDTAYRFFIRDYPNLVKHGAATVPFLLGRVKDHSVPADQETAAILLGEISATYNEEEPCDWREVTRTLRDMAKEPDLDDNPLKKDTEEDKQIRQVFRRAYRMITGEYPKY